jgi:hypothetical protein
MGGLAGLEEIMDHAGKKLLGSRARVDYKYRHPFGCRGIYGTITESGLSQNEETAGMATNRCNYTTNWAGPTLLEYQMGNQEAEEGNG